MAAIIIGLGLSLLFLVIKQIGRNIRFKFLSFLICVFVSFIFLILTDLGWWNVILLPVITQIGVFISLLIYPLTIYEVFKSSAFALNDYYKNLAKGQQIGTIKTHYGFKQGYERLLWKTLYAFTSSNTDTQKIIHNLYSKIFYPSSKIIKDALVQHVHYSIDKVIDESVYLKIKIQTSPNIYAYVFNIFICILQINEEATDNITRHENEKELV